MFCVGTEFTRLSIEKPDYWRSLIREVKSVYSGKITYAANWYKEYEEENPEVVELSEGWKKHLPAIKSVQERYNRKVLFTEMGYKSASDGAIKPWEWIDYSSDHSCIYSLETQANCYQAFFESVWGQDWFAGVHLWQFRGDFKDRKGKINVDFNPQGKPAEGVITKGFARVSPRLKTQFHN